MGCRLLQYSDVENAYDDPERIGRLAGCIDALRDEDTLVVGTGDNTAPGVLALVSDGAQAIDFFDAVDPDADTLGNHDFDHGLDGLRRLLDAAPQRWLCANLRTADGDPFGRADGVTPSTVVRRNGTAVGLVGVATPDTPSMSPPAADMRVEDPVTAVAREAEELRAAGADYVVALSHAGRLDDDIARETDVDAVLGGHVHVPRVERVDGTVCTRPGNGGERLVEVDLATGDVTSHDVADAPVDESVARALRERLDAAGLDEVVDDVSEPMSRERAVRYRPECRVGNFVADAYRWAGDTDVGLMNSGGIRRGDPLVGPVTVADLVGLVPFEEPVAVVELTGAELRDVLAESYGPALGRDPDVWNGNVSGCRVVWDDDREAVVDLSVGGDPVDPTATYSVATSDYLLHSTHEYPTMTAAHRVDTLGLQYDVLVAYARHEGVSAAVDGRTVRR